MSLCKALAMSDTNLVTLNYACYLAPSPACLGFWVSSPFLSVFWLKGYQSTCVVLSPLKAHSYFPAIFRQISDISFLPFVQLPLLPVYSLSSDLASSGKPSPMPFNLPQLAVCLSKVSRESYVLWLFTCLSLLLTELTSFLWSSVEPWVEPSIAWIT